MKLHGNTKSNITKFEGVIRAGDGLGFQYCLILWLIWKYKKYYQNKLKFHGVYPRNILPKIKDEVYVMIPDDYKSIETH